MTMDTAQRLALLERVLQFDPTEFPSMKAAAIECATRNLMDPVALLEARRHSPGCDCL